MRPGRKDIGVYCAVARDREADELGDALGNRRWPLVGRTMVELGLELPIKYIGALF